MKKLCLLVSAIMTIASIGCSSIDVAISKKVNVTKKMKKIAVFPFDIKGATWGDEFADAITHQFFKTGKIDVVEREAIKKVLKEQNLSMTGLVDENQAVKVGKLLGADVIITGRGTYLHYKKLFQDQVPNLIDTFTLKGINVETSALLFTVRKCPGKAWDWRYRMKYCCSGTLIWSGDDILVESSRYDDISEQVVSRILEALAEIEKGKQL
jgi:hypothetical protein